MRARHLPIASPCDEDWDAMTPTGCGKFCQACDKPVYDLSSMTEKQVRTLLAANAKGGICISYLRDSRGNVSFRASSKAPMVATAVVATALAACTPVHNPDVVEQAQPTAIELDPAQRANAYQPPAARDVVPVAEPAPAPPPVEPPEPEFSRVQGDWGPLDEPYDPPESEANKPEVERARVKGEMPAHSISIE